MRLNKEQREEIKEKYGVDRIWSFSQLSTYENCPWEYKMKYVDHKRVDSDNVYTVFGTFCHDTIQDYYAGNIGRSDLIKKWEEYLKEWDNDPFAYQFATAKIRSGYVDNLTHYFANTDDLILEGESTNEKPVLIKLKRNGKKYVFVGYIDTILKQGENLTLFDYKTSSKSGFSGAKLAKKSMQLQLYAIGEHQRTGIPYENINCKFDMMKYVTVHYKQENGKWKTSAQDRSQWVQKMERRLKTKLKKAGYSDDEQEAILSKAVELNSLDFPELPKEIAEQFYITNYLIDLDISDEACSELSEKVMDLCDKILDFEAMDELDMQNYLEVNYPYNPNNYYDKHLCAYHTSKEFKETELQRDNSILPEFDEFGNTLEEFMNDSTEDDLENLFM